jgi:predicted ATPase
MKISKIKIDNFRSIEQAEFDLTDFNIFVGQNNSGKTNFFEAIEYFYNGILKSSGGLDNLKYKRDPSLNMMVEIEFTGAQDGVNKMINEKNKTTISNALNGSDVVSFRRINSDKQRKMFINNKDCKTGTGFDPALNDFLPKFEYIHTKQYYDSVAKYATTTPIGKMLSGVLSTLLEDNPQYRSFQNKFAELFGDDKSAVKAEFNKMGDKVYNES